MVEKKDRGRKGKDKKDPDVGKAKVRLREQADGRCRTYVIQALNLTKTELMGRFCTVVDMGYGELRDLAILDAQEGLAVFKRNVAAVEQKAVEKRDALSVYTQEKGVLILSVIITGNLDDRGYGTTKVIGTTRYEAVQTVKSMEL
ncbi:hypothetical protein BGZ91_004138 [Linnemannia elongata]|nr:hypothetical protein BGZ91_004138 [Linnemannia elongata]